MLIRELRSNLEAGDIASLYLLVGEDQVARRQALMLLAERICPGDLRAWNMQEVEGSTATAGNLVAASTTAPFLGDRRLVVVRAFDQMDALEQETFLKALNPQCSNVVVLVADRLDKRTKLAKVLQRQATVVEVMEPGPDNIAGWVETRGRDYGLTFTGQAIQRLVDICGSDTGFLEQEMGKITTYLGGPGQVGEDLVTSLAARGEAETGQFTIFRLTEAVAEGRSADALSQLAELFAVGEPPLRILAMIARQYRLLLLATAWQKEGVAAAARAGGLKLYPMQRLFAQARTLSLDEIEAGLSCILEADMALKSGGGQYGTLKMLVVALSERKTPDVSDGRY